MTQRIQRVLYGDPENRAQVLRLRRFYMAQISYAMWYGMAWAAYSTGLFGASPFYLGLAGVGVALTQLPLFLLLRLGASRGYRDPALTLPQILVGLAWGLLLVAFAHEMRGLLLVVLMMTLLFGVFALSEARFWLVSIVALVGYVIVCALERALVPGRVSDAYYAATVVVLAAMLAWTAWFGGYVSRLRRRLRQRNAALEDALAHIRRLAEHDDLTGIHNRRYVMGTIQRLNARAARDGETFSVCIIDLDHFKDVNDRYGHAIGDALLVRFARLVESELRAMDFVAHGVDRERTFGRFGGEEFILLLPATSLDGALRCAERLRSHMERLREIGLPPVTLSAGVAECQVPESAEELLRRADRALYEAKAAGRNQVRRAA